MRQVLLPAIAVLSTFLASCVPSVYPLYTARDLAFDPALIGAWQEDGSPDESWTFTKLDDTTYRLVVKDGKLSAPFDAHLLRLGPHRFLDMTPHRDGLPQDVMPDIFEMSLIPGHLFLKVTQIEPVLRMAMLDPDWIEKRLKEHPSDLVHVKPRDKEIVLTAPTADLQKFILRHANDKDAFGDASELKKIR